MTPLWRDGPVTALRWEHSPIVFRALDAGAEARRDLMQALIAHLAGVRGTDVQLARSPAGAPRVASPPGWHVGVSQRGGQCLIGVAAQPIAVDREVADDSLPLWDMLTEREARDLYALNRTEQSRAWLRLWTIKEAHAKLVGEPRRLAPETIDTRVINSTRATASCEGVSHCWTRDTGDAIETVALWDKAA